MLALIRQMGFEMNVLVMHHTLHFLQDALWAKLISIFLIPIDAILATMLVKWDIGYIDTVTCFARSLSERNIHYKTVFWLLTMTSLALKIILFFNFKPLNYSKLVISTRKLKASIAKREDIKALRYPKNVL